MPRAIAKPSFEVADANRVLPLVRSIVTDIVANFHRMRELTREQRTLKTDTLALSSQPTVAALAALKSEAEERSSRMEDYFRELSELNVDLKDPERGLVDFACERGGRTVLLCWELGEATVARCRRCRPPGPRAPAPRVAAPSALPTAAKAQAARVRGETATRVPRPRSAG